MWKFIIMERPLNSKWVRSLTRAFPRRLPGKLRHLSQVRPIHHFPDQLYCITGEKRRDSRASRSHYLKSVISNFLDSRITVLSPGKFPFWLMILLTKNLSPSRCSFNCFTRLDYSDEKMNVFLDIRIPFLLWVYWEINAIIEWREIRGRQMGFFGRITNYFSSQNLYSDPGKSSTIDFARDEIAAHCSQR